MLYSKDTILQIPDKLALFAKFNVHVLDKDGFVNVQADDLTDLFVTSLEKEVVKIESLKTELIQKFNEDDYDYLVNGWKDKLKRTKDQRWGVFYAEKK